ncbi:MAG: periplasmic heavy metal sensor [Deltaproteobacteria bacterium]|nr:periplasmic heavy metal sensor [Deltaproteobacteria bacterium]
MFGFVLGTACLLGLIHVIRKGHHGHGCCGGGAWGGWHGHIHGRCGFGPRTMLRGLFVRLDTTPGQEKVIVSAVEELMQTGRQVHKEARSAREALAEAMRQPAMDASTLTAARSRLQSAFDTMSQAAERALSTVHEALDDRQRRTLADMIEEGHTWGGPWGGHPYRCH